MIQVNTIGGWGDFLRIHTLVLDGLPENSTVVELGVAGGRGLATILYVADKLGKKFNVFGVDHFKGTPGEEHLYANDMQRTIETLSGAGVTPDRYKLLVSDTAEAAKLFEKVDYVFLDADHATESVVKDLTAWLPKVVSGGYIGGHDWEFPSVSEAVRRFIPSPEVIDKECWLQRIGLGVRL